MCLYESNTIQIIVMGTILGNLTPLLGKCKSIELMIFSWSF